VKRVPYPSALAGALDLLLVGALVVASVLAVRHEPRWGFAGRDTLVYSVAADMWSHGAVPYRDFIDHKPPAAYLAYRAFFYAGGHSPRAIWQGMTCLAALAALFVYGGLRLTGRTVAAVAAAAALFFLIVTDTLALGLESQNNCETLAVFWGGLAFAGVLAYERYGRLLCAALAGVCLATAVLSKQTAACWLAPLGVHLATAHWQLPWRRRISTGLAGLVGFAAGGAIVIGVCLTYFAAQGALGPFYEWVIERNLAYASPSAAPGVRFHWWVLLEIYRWSLPKLTAPGGLPFTLALVLLPLAAITRRGYLARLTILWCAASLAGASAGLGVQSHYLVLLVLPLALALGATLEWLFGLVPERARIAPAPALLAVAVCATVFAPSVASLGKLMRGEPKLLGHMENSPMFRLGRAVARDALPGDRMLAFGDPFDPLFYSGLRPPGRYIFYPGPALQPDPEDFMRELRTTRPRFIYIGSDTYAPFVATQPGVQGMLKQYLDESYEPWLDGGTGRVYRRKP
jgi:Dolichyl-phosphate-mannose-protein mannosyltransferase